LSILGKELAIRQTAHELVQSYQHIVERINFYYDRLVELSEEAKVFGDYVRVFDSYSSDPRNKVIDSLTKAAWCRIFDILGVRKVMAITKWDQLAKDIDEGRMPPLTEENVLNHMLAYVQNFQTISREACLAAYETLTPGKIHRWHADYKSNKHFGIGKMVVLTGFIETTWSNGSDISHFKRDDLIEVDRVFHNLDGQNISVDSYHSPLVDAICSSKFQPGQTNYFAFQAYHNRNLHLRFLRPDLVERLVRICADPTVLAGSDQSVLF